MRSGMAARRPEASPRRDARGGRPARRRESNAGDHGRGTDRGTNVVDWRHRFARATTARGHIEKLPSGSFRVHAYAGTDPVSGKPRRLKQTCPDEAAAAATLGRLLSEADGDRFPNRQATLGQTLGKYLEVADLERTSRPATYQFPPEGGASRQARKSRGKLGRSEGAAPDRPLPRPTGHGRSGSALSILRSGPRPERTRQRPPCPTRSRRCRSRWRRSQGRTRGRSSRRRKSWS